MTHMNFAGYKRSKDITAGGSYSWIQDAEEIRIDCHENHVPAFAEIEIEKLYQNIYSSLVKLRTCGAAYGNTSTYIVRRGKTIRTVLLFQRIRGKVLVLNEVIRLDADELNRFAEYMFSEYPTVTVISFRNIHASAGLLKFPRQRFNSSEDVVVSLPATREEYLSGLGHETRVNLQRYADKLKSSFPSFDYSCHEKAIVNPRQVRDIINLNWARRNQKCGAPFDDKLTDRVIAMVRERGMVGVITIDGRVCAGTICYRVGSHYFMSISAHDPVYEHDGLGMLCTYLSICECIARGGREFHFLWSDYEHKHLLLGVRRDLQNLNVYRSHAHLLMNINVASKAVYAATVRHAQLWFRKNKRQDHVMLQLIIKSAEVLRALKRFSARMLLENK